MVEYFVLFTLLLLLPFLPGIAELLIREDDNPLDIKQDFSKDPAFFGKSFQKILAQALLQRSKRISEDSIEVVLSTGKPEILRLYKNTVGGKHMMDIVFAEDTEVKTDSPLESYKEVVVNGNFTTWHPCKVRSLLVFGNLNVNYSLSVVRWVHVEGIAKIRARSVLGVNFYAREIKITAPCTFKRMFANKVQIGEEVKEEAFKKEEAHYIKGTIRSKGSLNIKTEDRKLIIEGSLISDEDIVAEGGIWIKGDVFSHAGVVFLKNVVVGEAGKVKSVVGKKRVVLGQKVKVYGYVHTDGSGVVEI